MKKKFKKVIGIMVAVVIAVSPAVGSVNGPFLMTAEAHSGRTDARGGHHDNKNKSGLGSYHYHCGGHPAHLHPNGVCPYAGGGTDSASQGNNSTSNRAVQNTTPTLPEPTVAAEPVSTLGWNLDSVGWWYKDSESTYLKDGVYKIDGYYYIFNADGYMLTSWREIGDYWYYFDEKGHMLLDTCELIDDSYCHFDKNGKWDGEFYESYEEYEHMCDEHDWDWDY